MACAGGDADPPRLASAASETRPREVARPAPPDPNDPIVRAKALIGSCRRTYAKVDDYTCTFFKRERIDGKMTGQFVMHMKARTRPMSVYFKFNRPNAGREAIYVAGKHGGKAVVHDVGLGKLLAGTMKLDPLGDTAMEDCRHPVTEAGIGHLIETIATAWDKELSPADSRVIFYPDSRVGDRSCLMIESIHPRKRDDFLFHMVKVYIDKEHDLPIRFEAYDWPVNGAEPVLVEEYTYTKLKVNVGLTDRDFDPANKGYSFGRF